MEDNIRDSRHDGQAEDRNAGRNTPGSQERPMSDEEVLDTASNDSMDASDPQAITQPGKGDPVPSSGFRDDEAGTDQLLDNFIGGIQGKN